MGPTYLYVLVWFILRNSFGLVDRIRWQPRHICNGCNVVDVFVWSPSVPFKEKSRYEISREVSLCRKTRAAASNNLFPKLWLNIKLILTISNWTNSHLLERDLWFWLQKQSYRLTVERLCRDSLQNVVKTKTTYSLTVLLTWLWWLQLPQ